MNIYEFEFENICPVNQDRVVYAITVEVSQMIQVEMLKEICCGFDPSFQEKLADNLSDIFGGKQTIVADHRGVKITTKRGFE